MRILLISRTLNGLVQLLLLELKALGHLVALSSESGAEAIQRAAQHFRPELVLSTELDAAFTHPVSPNHRCFRLTSGPADAVVGSPALGDAIRNGDRRWGVRVIEVEPCSSSVFRIWSVREFTVRAASWSSIFRDELTRATTLAVGDAIQRVANCSPLSEACVQSTGTSPVHAGVAAEMGDQWIDWGRDSARTILGKIWSADSAPGVPDEIAGISVRLFGAHAEARLRGDPGMVVAQSNGAICRATVDGAVWISHLKPMGNGHKDPFKLPATQVLAGRLGPIPDVSLAPDTPVDAMTFRDIWYSERNDVGYIQFRLYNGAMDTRHCQCLEQFVRHARRRPIKAIVLMGGRDFWSNGIDLNQIEAADDPAEEAWRNINAMNDFVLSLLMATDQLTVAAVYGNAAAGGAMLALACDRVVARAGTVLYPHYRSLGGFRGSDYWTYTLPKRVGPELARRLMEQCLPITAQSAHAIGLVDQVLQLDSLDGSDFGTFQAEIRDMVEDLVTGPGYESLVRNKQARWQADDWVKPLELYRVAELAEVSRSLWGSVSRYHRVRSNYVRKQSCVDAANCLAETDGVCGNLYCEPARAKMAERLSDAGS